LEIIIMAETYEWSRFYAALCAHGPTLLGGLDEETRHLVAMLAADTDRFWSDGLQDVLAQAATAGDLRTGVLRTLQLWRENVLTALSDDFSMDFDWSAITISTQSPLIDQLVTAATPKP
jgi:hypothetical protein